MVRPGRGFALSLRPDRTSARERLVLTVMTRLLVAMGVIACLSLSACGGGGDSSTTTSPPSQGEAVSQGPTGVADTVPSVPIRWSRCPGSSYGTSVAGISCRDAQVHRFETRSSTGSAARIRTSDPRTFTQHGFDCTQFPLEDGFGWHIVCARGSQHISWYFTP
jgi:hypothetical protein